MKKDINDLSQLKNEPVNVKDSTLLQSAFLMSVKKIEQYLSNGLSDNEINESRIAMQTVSAYSRLRAVEAHEVGIKFSAARAMAHNADELRVTLQHSLPEVTKNL